MELSLCKCGCGNFVSKKTNKYIQGHNRRNTKLDTEHKKALLKSNIGRKKSLSEKQKIKEKIQKLHDNPKSSYNIRKEEISSQRSVSLKKAWRNKNSKWHSKNTKKIQREKNLKNRKRGIYSSGEYKNKLSSAHKKLWSDPDSSYNSPDRGKRISKQMKELYKDVNYLEKLQKGLKAKPNKSEKRLYKIIKTITNKFIFVGDFSLWIGGKNPDFIDEENRKIIELFGDYWHSKKHTGMNKDEHSSQRYSHFKKFGYETVIIWESDLNDEVLVLEKIKKLIGGKNE